MVKDHSDGEIGKPVCHHMGHRTDRIGRTTVGLPSCGTGWNGK